MATSACGEVYDLSSEGAGVLFRREAVGGLKVGDRVQLKFRALLLMTPLEFEAVVSWRKEGAPLCRVGFHFMDSREILERVPYVLRREFNQRAEQRTPIQERVEVSFRKNPSSPWTQGLLRDLSPAGASLRISPQIRSEIDIGDSIEIELHLPAGSEPLQLIASIRSLRSESEELHCGVEFDAARSPRFETLHARLNEFLAPLREGGPMPVGIELDEEQVARLATQLRGIKQALRTVAKGMGPPESLSRRLRLGCSQIEWAASHLQEAVREFEGRDSDPGRESDGHERPRAIVPPTEGLRGHSQAVGIPEVLGFLASLEKSGVLRIHANQEDFLIQLDRGGVVYAQGDNPPSGQLLGEILLAQGSLTAKQMQRAMAKAPGEQVIGRTLLLEGLVDEAQLCIALTYQVQLLFRRIFTARDVVYQFDEGVSIVPPLDIHLNVTSLLLESARLNDEADRREEEGPGAEAGGERRSA